MIKFEVLAGYVEMNPFVFAQMILARHQRSLVITVQSTLT